MEPLTAPLDRGLRAPPDRARPRGGLAGGRRGQCRHHHRTGRRSCAGRAGWCTPVTGSPRWRNCLRRRSCCSTSRRGNSWPSPGPSCHGGPPGPGRASGPARGRARWTGRSTGPCRGRPSPAGAPSPSTSAAPSTRWRGRRRPCGAGATPERPFVLVAQPSVVDPTRAPAGRHTLWAYCHVPNGSDVDMRERIEAQIERFAPGFRDRILARAVRTASEAEATNPNLLGRGHQRRRGHPAADRVPTGGALEPLPDAARGGVPLLGLDAPRRRGARDVRRLGRPDGDGGAPGLTAVGGSALRAVGWAWRAVVRRRRRPPARSGPPAGTRPRSRPPRTTGTRPGRRRSGASRGGPRRVWVLPRPETTSMLSTSLVSS